MRSSCHCAGASACCEGLRRATGARCIVKGARVCTTGTTTVFCVPSERAIRGSVQIVCIMHRDVHCFKALSARSWCIRYPNVPGVCDIRCSTCCLQSRSARSCSGRNTPQVGSLSARCSK